MNNICPHIPSTKGRVLKVCNEAWLFTTDTESSHFAENAIVYEENGKTYALKLPIRFSDANPLNLDEIEGKEIPTDVARPDHTDDLVVCSTIDPDTMFVKTMCLYDIAFTDANMLKNLVLREAKICQQLMQAPHPNIVEYFGCQVVDGKVHGLVLKRYVEVLSNRVRRPFDIEKILQEISAGLAHLHSLDLVHGDLSPYNIMVNADDVAIIIDFDSCTKEGTVLGKTYKLGTPFFYQDSKVSSKENDFYSLRCVSEFLEKALKKLEVEEIKAKESDS